MDGGARGSNSGSENNDGHNFTGSGGTGWYRGPVAHVCGVWTVMVDGAGDGLERDSHEHVGDLGGWV